MPWVGLVEPPTEKRTLPSPAIDVFAELARAGYRGLVDVEGDGTAEQLRNACVTVRNQAREAGLSL